jgi:hypothetical protein
MAPICLSRCFPACSCLIPFALACLLHSSPRLAASNAPDTLDSHQILAFPLSDAGAEMRQCTIQMLGSLGFSNQSLQCCCFIFFRVLLYSLTASLCLACIVCVGSVLCLYDILPSLFACLLSCVSSFVHHLFDFGQGFVTGTSS